MLNRTLLTRCLRNVFFRNLPFYAHYFLTERCNLKCKYCEVYKNPINELNTEGHKKIIDRLAEMNIAILSFTGGEPLLRDDLFHLIDYAKAKEFHIKLTSNGTFPKNKYKDLLSTGVDQIQISLDGIDGSELPFSKIDPKIISTIEFLYTHKTTHKLYISTLYYNGNAPKICKMIETFNFKFPKLEIFVQPIVTGIDGEFRSKNYNMVNMDFLDIVSQYPNVVNPTYFNDHCKKYFEANGRPQWGCKAGRLFFDIKPNGDFWLCQDKPTKLNLLNPNFLVERKMLDFEKLTENCKGCFYSCYIITQKAFELKHSITWYHGSKRF